jgi:hypothetical protein
LITGERRCGGDHEYLPPAPQFPVEISAAGIYAEVGLYRGCSFLVLVARRGASMPWPEILGAIVAIYVVVKSVQGVRDFIIWYQEGRAFAAERKRLKDLRHQERSAGVNMPALKERPKDPSKPPLRPAKPPKTDGGVAGI